MAPKVDGALITQVRGKVLAAYESSKELYHEDDIGRIKNEDAFISRYLTREQLDPLAAVETITGGFRFAKRMGIRDIKESEFTPELLSMVVFGGKDKNGNQMVYLRYKTAKKIVKRNSKDQEKLKRLALYYFNKIENETKGNYNLVIDARSLAIRDLVKYANKDIAAVAFWLGTAAIRFSPDAVGTLYLYEVPRFFSAVTERVIKLAPNEYSGQVKLVRKKDFEKIASKDEIPDFMGGKLAGGSKAPAEDDADSGDEGNEVTNLEDIEKALEEAENSNL